MVFLGVVNMQSKIDRNGKFAHNILCLVGVFFITCLNICTGIM
jgi:hypothetical protein